MDRMHYSAFTVEGNSDKLETVLHNPKTKKLKHFEPCRKLPTAVSQYMAEIGRRGGASKSEAKKELRGKASLMREP